ncbi:hypothetical protein BT96DRAFT_934966 [Gymnopus androsaceus JB14]|uniref:LysM domain-containing protein n=1 Tax=Gymnopus androsaceus JB14 TaxID=1447944 RepID=A0A6A4I5P1_9AGAR|nr:hypothetical protein BT96DRAFT_934966 [Gymnopus androsaceus JB14]
MFSLALLVACAMAFMTLQVGDTCATIIVEFDIIIVDLETANPSINSDCTNLIIREAVIPNIDPLHTGTCWAYRNVFCVVLSDDICISIAVEFGVTIEVLDAANPEIDSVCDDLFVGEASHVNPVL